MDDAKRENARAEHKQLFQQERLASRVLMLQYLYSCDSRQSWSATSEELDSFFEMTAEADEQFSEAAMKGGVKRARKLLPQLVERVPELDELIVKASSHWSLRRMGRMDLNILRLGAFEFLHVQGITVAIAINEAVELAKIYGQSDESHKFINGVLQQIHNTTAAKQP